VENLAVGVNPVLKDQLLFAPQMLGHGQRNPNEDGKVHTRGQAVRHEGTITRAEAKRRF
jgi:hypothetical protein